MTVVLPRVSTAGSLRMMARRLAMRFTPMARVIVTIAGNSSGIAPTARATAPSNISSTPRPLASPTRNVSPASTRISFSKLRLKRPNLRVSGVVRSTWSWREVEMQPTSVSSPVATTSPMP